VTSSVTSLRRPRSVRGDPTNASPRLSVLPSVRTLLRPIADGSGAREGLLRVCVLRSCPTRHAEQAIYQRKPRWANRGGPPGTRTPNLRIKSLVQRCRPEPREAIHLLVCVSVVPIVSHLFPFLHGDRTGTSPGGCCHRNRQLVKTPETSSFLVLFGTGLVTDTRSPPSARLIRPPNFHYPCVRGTGRLVTQPRRR
jgi:hypothetical protein